MVEKTTAHWGGTGAEFVCAEVLEYLSAHEEVYDAVYSIFGAAWFTDPSRLFLFILPRLKPGVPQLGLGGDVVVCGQGDSSSQGAGPRPGKPGRGPEPGTSTTRPDAQ
ncbi:hypothetical protein ACWGRF_17815 [Streptomyces zhihengii]